MSNDCNSFHFKRRGSENKMKALAEIILVKDERMRTLQTLEKYDFSSLPVKGDFLRLHPYNHLEVIERHILYYPDFAKVEIFVEDRSINVVQDKNKEGKEQ
jgi:hypothetical protein